MAFAHAARVVDVRNVSGAHRRAEEFYFVYFSHEVGVSAQGKLADQERLIVR